MSTQTEPDETPLRRAAPYVFAILLPIATLGPFLNKAYHIDDTVYLYVAEQIIAEPFDFFGFDMNWRGTSEPLYETNKNPPGVSYYLAFVGWIAGFSERVIHAALILPAIALSLGVATLARLYRVSPWFSVAASALSPVVWLSSTTAMSDVSMLAWYVWAIALWILGMRGRRRAYLALAALCIACSILTKYFGITAIPLAFAYGIAQRKSLGGWALWLLVPVATTLAYGAWTDHLYGINLVTEAMGFAGDRSFNAGTFTVPQMNMLGLCFLGGCHLVALAFLPKLWPRPMLIAWLVFGSAITGLLVVNDGSIPVKHPDITHLTLFNQLLFGVFYVGGLNILALCVNQWFRRRDAETLLLALWVVGTFAFAAMVNWSVNGRAVLAAAPPLALLIAQRLQALSPDARINMRDYALLVPVAGVALWITIADTELANAGRTAARQLASIRTELPETTYYQGHFGFQYYMDRAGFQHLDFDHDQLTVGDAYIVPSNSNANLQELPADQVREILRMRIPLRAGCSTLNLERGAGFYHYGFGPLPYLVGVMPPESWYAHVVAPNQEQQPVR